MKCYEFEDNLSFINPHILPWSVHPQIISIGKLILQWKIVIWLLENDLHALKNVSVNKYILFPGRFYSKSFLIFWWAIKRQFHRDRPLLMYILLRNLCALLWNSEMLLWVWRTRQRRKMCSTFSVLNPQV